MTRVYYRETVGVDYRGRSVFIGRSREVDDDIIELARMYLNDGLSRVQIAMMMRNSSLVPAPTMTVAFTILDEAEIRNRASQPAQR